MAVAPPPEPACPCCGGAPGRGTIRVETRENKGSTFGFRPGTRYLVRWVDVPLVCAACARQIEIRRYLADALCLAPLVAAFVGLVATDSKAFLWILLLYAVFLLKWSWGLGYVWADAILYGGWLESSLTRFAPPGDRNTIRFPAGLWHCFMRIGGAPALLVALLAAVAGAFGSHPARHETPSAPAAAAPDASESTDPRERARARSEREIAAARAFLESARNIAVPVDPVTLALKKKDVQRDDMNFFTVYANPSDLPSQTAYQLMTGPQLLSAFLKTEGHDVDFLTINGPNLPLSRWQAANIAPTLPAAEPLDPEVRQSP